VAERERALFVDAQPPAGPSSHVLFVPGEGYSLVEEAGAPPAPGTSLELAGQRYVVLRLGASPLPDDARTCAFLSN
jgi:hypothetical protein